MLTVELEGGFPSPLERNRIANLALRLRGICADPIDTVVVLGSGWQASADTLGETVATALFSQVFSLPAPSAPGHSDTISVRDYGGKKILVFESRLHLYEGHNSAEVCRPLRSAIFLGAHKVLLTNASGSLHPGLQPGNIAFIRDHVNLMGTSPLLGDFHIDTPAKRFLPQAYPYHIPALPGLVEPPRSVVYAGMLGPQYETPAEGNLLRNLGCDVAGMSTVQETIAAKAMDATVVGLTLVTNYVAGVAAHAAPIAPLELAALQRTPMTTALSAIIAALTKL